MTHLPPLPEDVAAVLETYPQPARRVFDHIRATVHVAAGETGVGPLNECLKWGEPSWLTQRNKTGTTLRLAWKASLPEEFGLYVNCRTSLVETMRMLYPDTFRYESTRAMMFRLDAEIPDQAIGHCARLALTYHRNKHA